MAKIWYFLYHSHQKTTNGQEKSEMWDTLTLETEIFRATKKRLVCCLTIAKENMERQGIGDETSNYNLTKQKTACLYQRCGHR